MNDSDQCMVMKKRTFYHQGIVPDHTGKIPDEGRWKGRDESCFLKKSVRKVIIYRLFMPRPP